MSEELLFEVREHIAFVTINRPKSMNALSHGLDDQLAERWDQIDADPEIWVAVLSSAGERAFCAGADISGGTDGHPARLSIGGGLTGIGGSSRVLKKPLVVATQGYVLGAGLELALCADVIVAADTSQFGLPEVKAGIIGESGVVHRVMRQLPYRVAMSMILTSERMPASDALRYGLVNEVVPYGQLHATAEAWAKKISSGSPLAAQAAKNAALRGLEMSLEDALSTKYEMIEAYAISSDVKEGNQARAEKRNPVWSGR